MPAHSRVNARVTTLKRRSRSSRARVIGRSIRPSIAKVQRDGSRSPGISPLLRTKCLSVGVMASSRRCGGVSAQRGTIVEDREAVLALNDLLGGEYHGNEVSGYISMEGDSGPDQCAHGRQAPRF